MPNINFSDRRTTSNKEAELLNPWKKIILAESEKKRIHSALELGLPASASLRDIINTRAKISMNQPSKEIPPPPSSNDFKAGIG